MKSQAYIELVQKRKLCRRCDGLTNPVLASSPEHDSEEIGPWSRLHGDLNAEIMIIGQDWGDLKYFRVNQGLDDLRNPTTRTLEKLLHSIGINVALDKYGQGPSKLFLTNALLCIKNGGLQAKVEAAWFENCGSLFLRQQVEIVIPRVVVTLGERAYRAICGAFFIKANPFRVAVESAHSMTLFASTKLVPVYHCGMRILNTHRPLEMQIQDWQRVKMALDEK